MDVVVVGSCMIDIVSYVDRLPRPGETLHGDRVHIGFGGKGANQCVMAARLGAKAAMVAKVGTDSFGADYLKNFVECGINSEHVKQTSTSKTGLAPIAVEKSGQNSIIIVAGANNELSESDVDEAEALISSATVLVCQLEVPPHTSLHALKLAKKHNVITILNPAPGCQDLDPEVYKYCDICCPNESEAELLTGVTVTSAAEAEVAGRRLCSLGCACVVVTLGASGAMLVGRDGDSQHVIAEQVAAVDTTGAGDAFIGALCYFLAKYRSLDSLPNCVQRACRVATLSVQKQGTQTSFPHKSELPPELLEV